ncbi:hypothetical protein [Bordetella genomosp. 1]|uniref:GAF domain-containing protein n=1 Tax=Bordetella genomosp. 1 TaxID=1395607 RepID=A0ABX4F489_9BORD|nr:hypothetical protein [Bordetella genomosp. 1]OZI68528.1 hypothetical protein CAL27_03435 [Bordetella genomosp. 1]
MKHEPIPSITPAPAWRRRWCVEVLTGLPPAILATLGAIRLWTDTEHPGWWLQGAMFVSFWMILACVFKVFLALRSDNDETPDRALDGIRAAMHVLHAATAQACGIAPGRVSQHLRVTFHRVVPPLEAPTHIEQVVNYVGGNRNGAGRTFSVSTGLTGAAVRTNQPHLLSSTAGSDEEHRRELVVTWGYTATQARERLPGRYSALAVPIGDGPGHLPIAVVYFDSDLRGLFDEPDAYQAIMALCDGVNHYIHERYRP